MVPDDPQSLEVGRPAGRQRRLLFLAGELIIIIVGVLIALAVDAWYEGVVERRDERTYLEQLLEDLGETERQMLAADARNVEAGQSVAKLLAGFASIPRPSADSARVWLGHARFVDNPVPIIGTAEALVATGDLRLVRDPALRVAITRWLSRSRDYWLVPIYQLEELHRVKYYELTAFVDPMALPRADRATADSLYGYVPPARSPYPLDSERLFRERRAYGVLSDLYHLKASMASFRRGMLRDAEQLREVIEGSMPER